MGVYARRDSKFWWMWLEGTRPPVRISTSIPIGAGTARKTSEQDAEAVYRAAMGDLARGAFKLPKTRPSITFRQYAERYLEHVAQHQRSPQQAMHLVRKLRDTLGDVPLRELDTKRLEEWKSDLARSLKHSSVNRLIQVLKPLLRRAVPEYLDVSPADKLKRFSDRPVPVTILSESAEDAILAIAGPAERALVLLGLDALLRLSDVSTLRAEHDRGTYLDVVDPKTNPYKVPVSTRLRAALDALTPQDGWYFPSPRQEGPVSDAWTARTFKALCVRAGVPAGKAEGGITFHGLRHTGATRAARVVKLTVVQRLGGWRSLRQLARYDHPEDAEIVRATEAIGSRDAHGPAADVRKKA